jgi:DDE superfamily endonuclease
VLGADDTGERRSGRQLTANGGYRDAVRATKKQVSRWFGLTWVSMMLLVPVPWARRVWALPFLTALCGPAEQAKRGRHQTSVAWGRQMMQQGRRWLPRRQLVVVVDGGFAAVALALACVTPQVVMVARLRWEAALSHRPGPPPPGKRGPNPTKGQRQRSLQGWVSRSETPWATVEVAWSGGQRQPRWGFSHPARGATPRLPPVAIRDGLVCDPEDKRRLEAFVCTDLEATPVPIREWVLMRWSVEVTFEEARAHLGLETQRQWSDHAIARTTPVRLALFSMVTMRALRLSPGGQIPVPVTAWYRTAEPTFADCLTLVRRHRWCARFLMNSAVQPACVQFPRETFELLIHGLLLAA